MVISGARPRRMAASPGRRPIWRRACARRSSRPRNSTAWMAGVCRPFAFGCGLMLDDCGMSNEQRGFFGRRKGHPLRARQAELFGSLLPRLALDLTRAAPADLARLFPRSVESVRLEIGFGGAEHLIGQAQAHPHTGFIGC